MSEILLKLIPRAKSIFNGFKGGLIVEVKQINQLMLAMCRHQVKKLRWKCENDELELELGSAGEFSINGERFLDQEVENPLKSDFERHRTEFEKQRPGNPSLPAVEKMKTRPSMDEKEEEDPNMKYITSPMVGTVYLSPSPADKAFVSVGDIVEANTVVCIIEAMKVMNEVKSGIQGVVKEILVDKSQPVDFGAKLFKIAP